MPPKKCESLLIDSLQKMLDMTDEQALDLFRVMGIRFVGDSEQLDEHLMTLLLVILPNDSEARVQLIDSIVHLTLEGGKIRQEFNFEYVDQQLRSRGLNLRNALNTSFKVISQIPGETSRHDVQRFFRGFEATWPLIRDDVPVRRKCYFSEHRKIILQESEKFNMKGKLRCCVIVGPKGVGKNTLSKQIAFDLASHGYVVAWLDTYPPRLCNSLIREFSRLTTSKKRVHLFARLGLSKSDSQPMAQIEHVLRDLRSFVCALGRNPKVSLYLTIDSNQYELFRDDMNWVLDLEPQILTLPLNLDGKELDELIDKLRCWDALGRLEGRPDNEIRQVFDRKAHKKLLVALIEATQGTDDNENFHSILRREYSSLPVAVQLAYPLIALSHAHNIQTPYSLLCEALKEISVDTAVPTVEHFRTVLRDVLLLRGEWTVTRHPLIARTLCEALANLSSSISSPEDYLWMPLIVGLLRGIDENDSNHATYLQEFAANKVVSILKEKLDALANQLAVQRFTNLKVESVGLVINAIARTFQGRGDLAQAIFWAIKCRDEMWQSNANNADVILAYCYLATRNRFSALEAAKRLSMNSGNPGSCCTRFVFYAKLGSLRKPKEYCNLALNRSTTWLVTVVSEGKL